MWLAAAGAAAHHPGGDQPGADRVRLQAGQPARENPGRAVRPGKPGTTTRPSSARPCSSPSAWTVSSLTLIIALPLTTLLQRSFRHARLLDRGPRGLQERVCSTPRPGSARRRAQVGRAVRTSSPLAVALLDLDRFKQINDT